MRIVPCHISLKLCSFLYFTLQLTQHHSSFRGKREWWEGGGNAQSSPWDIYVISPKLVLDQVINRKLVSGEVCKILFGVFKREFNCLRSWRD